MPEQQFPLIEVRGDAAARGHAHGETLRDAIHQTIAFYLEDVFAGVALSEAELRTRAAGAEALTTRYAPALGDEIRAIAAAAALEPWQIFLLNARTEILNARVNECTAIYFEDSAVLAQNWDWLEPLEALVAVLHHTHRDGFQHVSLCEPGMVGKTGLNSAGIGVCLNILFAPHDLHGLPVHILIGAVLNARSVADAHALLLNSGQGKASHLLVATNDTALSVEYFGDARYVLEPVDGVLLHTNHCLGLGAKGRSPDLSNSCARYDALAAAVRTAPQRDAALASTILSDRSGGENAILRDYRAQDVLGTQRVGTCATVLMDLAHRTFAVRRGPSVNAPFLTTAVNAAVGAA